MCQMSEIKAESPSSGQQLRVSKVECVVAVSDRRPLTVTTKNDSQKINRNSRTYENAGIW